MTVTFDDPAPSISLPRWILFGFVAGFLSVLVFHQGANSIAYLLGWNPNPAYAMRAVPPLGVPQVISLAFWGGVWFSVFAAVSSRLPQSLRSGAGFFIAAIVFGGLFISTFNWFVLAPLRGQALGNGFVLVNMLRGMTYNGIFGLGGAVWMTVGLRLLGSRN